MASDKQAFYNVSVSAVNEGLDAHHFGLSPTDNFWDGDSVSYHFYLFDIYCVANVNARADGILVFRVAVDPTDRAFQPLMSAHRGGDCKGFFMFRLERAEETKIINTPKYSCKHAMATRLVNGEPVPTPNGFLAHA